MGVLVFAIPVPPYTSCPPVTMVAVSLFHILVAFQQSWGHWALDILFCKFRTAVCAWWYWDISPTLPYRWERNPQAHPGNKHPIEMSTEMMTKWRFLLRCRRRARARAKSGDGGSMMVGGNNLSICWYRRLHSCGMYYVFCLMNNYFFFFFVMDRICLCMIVCSGCGMYDCLLVGSYWYAVNVWMLILIYLFRISCCVFRFVVVIVSWSQKM